MHYWVDARCLPTTSLTNSCSVWVTKPNATMLHSICQTAWNHNITHDFVLSTINKTLYRFMITTRALVPSPHRQTTRPLSPPRKNCFYFDRNITRDDLVPCLPPNNLHNLNNSCSLDGKPNPFFLFQLHHHSHQIPSIQHKTILHLSIEISHATTSFSLPLSLMKTITASLAASHATTVLFIAITKLFRYWRQHHARRHNSLSLSLSLSLYLSLSQNRSSCDFHRTWRPLPKSLQLHLKRHLN